MFYAQHSPYGSSMFSMGDELLRFDTKKERDEWVLADVFDGNFHRAAVTGSVARRWYPKAFRDGEFELAESRWKNGVYQGMPTGGEYAYMS